MIAPYYYGDLQEHIKRIRHAHQLAEAYRRKVIAVTGLFPPPTWDLQKAEDACVKRLRRFYGQISNPLNPHQGKRECARRIRQGRLNG